MDIEALLCEAAPGANDLFLSELPDPKDCHYTVSKRFERKMKQLLKRQKSPVLYWVQRSVACFLLVVLLGGASILTFSAEARAAFFGWVQEVFETYFSYTFTGEKAEILDDIVYRPTWLPDGYNVVVEPEPGSPTISIYMNEKGSTISISYAPDTEISILQIEQDGIEISSVFVNEIPADFYFDNRTGASNTLVWADSDKKVIFWINAPLDVKDITRIAESMEMKKIK